MAGWNYKDFWDESLSQFKKELGDEEFNIWFSKLEYIRAEEAEIFVSVPTPFFSELFSPKYLSRITGKINELTGKSLKITIEVQKKEKRQYKANGKISNIFR